jgi:Cdc6-like AAA superfamily ATPase
MCRILNISGVPGVGKRTAVKLCVKKAKLYRNLIHAEVAISKNWSLSCLYNQILKKLEVCALNINEESQLDRLFRSNEPFPCDGIVLVISSADMLTNNQQAFLMKIMGWLSEAGDKLTVVFTSAGVGFSINLKNGYDGLLVDEVIFPAYNAEQLEHIVKGKLDSDQHLF